MLCLTECNNRQSASSGSPNFIPIKISFSTDCNTCNKICDAFSAFPLLDCHKCIKICYKSNVKHSAYGEMHTRDIPFYGGVLRQRTAYHTSLSQSSAVAQKLCNISCYYILVDCITNCKQSVLCPPWH